MIPYSTKVKVKPIYKQTLLEGQKLTNEGVVETTGELVTEVKQGDRVYYNPEPNTMFDGYFYCDKEYILAVCN
jgi:hypothetical protein